MKYQKALLTAAFLAVPPLFGQSGRISMVMDETTMSKDNKMFVAKAHAYITGKKYLVGIGCVLKKDDCYILKAGGTYLVEYLEDNDPDAYSKVEPIVGSIRVEAHRDKDTAVSGVYFVLHHQSDVDAKMSHGLAQTKQ